MNGKTHTILGVSTAIALFITHPSLDLFGTTIVTAIGIPFAVPGSLLPDIDIERSKMGQKHKWLSKHLKHRGITHTLFIPAVIAAIIYFSLGKVPFLPDAFLGLEIGWLAHILADMFNGPGVPLLWPLSKGRISVAHVQTSSTAQQVIFIAIWEVVLLIWIWLTYGASVMTLLNL